MSTSPSNQINQSFLFTSAKAGMDGLDREQINQIISEATKNSRMAIKNKNDLELIKQRAIKINNSLQQLHKNTLLYSQIQNLATSRLNNIKTKRRLDKIWFHLDMDMYFAAVEIRDDPSLANIPMAVGSKQMLSTSNYIARKYGVRSAMPGFLALKLCPQLKIIPGDYSKYKRESLKIMKILTEYDDNIEQIGLDEAYLDLTDYCKDRNIDNNKESIELIVNEIKTKIYNETQLTCSIGIACNKMLAKICSDYNKPNGFYYLEFNSEIIEQFMLELNIRKIPFIGQKCEQKLNSIGIYQCKHLLERYIDLFYIFDEERFDFFIRSALGIGSYKHHAQQELKSISRGSSFQITKDKVFLANKCKELAKRVFTDIQKENEAVNAKTLSIQVIDYNEEKRVKCVSKEDGYFDKEDDIINTSISILHELLVINEYARMIRVRVSGFNREVTGKNSIIRWLGVTKGEKGENEVIQEEEEEKDMNNENDVNDKVIEVTKVDGEGTKRNNSMNSKKINVLKKGIRNSVVNIKTYDIYTMLNNMKTVVNNNTHRVCTEKNDNNDNTHKRSKSLSSLQVSSLQLNKENINHAMNSNKQNKTKIHLPKTKTKLKHKSKPFHSNSSLLSTQTSTLDSFLRLRNPN